VNRNLRQLLCFQFEESDGPPTFKSFRHWFHPQCRRKLLLFIGIRSCMHTRMSDQKQSHFEKMVIQTTTPQKAEMSFRNGTATGSHGSDVLGSSSAITGLVWLWEVSTWGSLSDTGLGLWDSHNPVEVAWEWHPARRGDAVVGRIRPHIDRDFHTVAFQDRCGTSRESRRDEGDGRQIGKSESR
jgi:hypothetical protein